MTAPVEPGRDPVIIVVGHDRHRVSSDALATAIDLAQRMDGQLHVVHCVTVDDYGIDPDSDEFEKERDRNLQRERASIDEALAATSLSWSYHQGGGDPAADLVRVAAEVDASLIVVGATHGGTLHRLLGSDAVANRLLHLQQRPVVVVPPSAPAPSGDTDRRVEVANRRSTSRASAQP